MDGRRTSCLTRHHERGVVLIVSYLAVSVLLILQAAYMSRVVEDHKTALHYTQRLQALHTGEAGLDDTIAALRGAAGFPGFGPTDFGNGEYESTVSPGPADDQRRVEVRGYFPSRLGVLNTDFQQRTLAAIVRVTPEDASFSLKGRDTIRIKGDLRVDCYDSSVGPYPNVACPEGDVLGNEGAASTIRVDGDTVMGPRRLFCAFGCPDPEVAIEILGAREDGGKLALREPYVPPIPNLPNPPVPPLVVPPGQTVTLPAGTYEFNSIRVMPNGRLLGIGPGQLIVRVRQGVALEDNARFSHSDLPPRLELETRTMSMAVGSQFYGTVVCQGNFSATGNPEVFGQIQCLQVNADAAGLTVHYDRQLPVDGSNGNEVAVQLWRRDSAP